MVYVCVRLNSHHLNSLHLDFILTSLYFVKSLPTFLTLARRSLISHISQKTLMHWFEEFHTTISTPLGAPSRGLALQSPADWTQSARVRVLTDHSKREEVLRGHSRVGELADDPSPAHDAVGRRSNSVEAVGCLDFDVDFDGSNVSCVGGGVVGGDVGSGSVGGGVVGDSGQVFQ